MMKTVISALLFSTAMLSGNALAQDVSQAEMELAKAKLAVAEAQAELAAAKLQIARKKTGQGGIDASIESDKNSKTIEAEVSAPVSKSVDMSAPALPRDLSDQETGKTASTRLALPDKPCLCP